MSKMLRLLIPLLATLAATASALDERGFYRSSELSPASESQIRFALENKYDDTGPGAKNPEYAYNTYKTLDEALVAYLDDPDTKLPEKERERVISRLVQPSHNYGRPLQRYYPKTVEEYTGYKPPQSTPAPFVFAEKKPIYYPLKTYQSTKFDGFKGLNREVSNSFLSEGIQPFRLQKIQAVKVNPVNVAHYSRLSDLQDAHDQFSPHPKYTYSYGVHDKSTGDSKSAQETRTGGTVQGFYSFMDAYTADDNNGFRATVDRTTG